MKHRKSHIKSKVYGLKPKKHIFKNPIFWTIFGFLAIASTFLYLLVFFAKVQVGIVSISGNNNVKAQDIETIAWSDINRKVFSVGPLTLTSKSILLTGSQKITSDILKNFPEIATASVSKKLMQTINIQVKERVPFAVYCSEDCSYIDQDGIIFKTPDQMDNMTVIKYKSTDKQFKLGDRAVEKNIVEKISKMKKILVDNFQIDIKNVTISEPSKLEVQTTENWMMFFDLESDIDSQITKMHLLLKDEIKPEDRQNLQYIDLRFKDRAYYK